MVRRHGTPHYARSGLGVQVFPSAPETRIPGEARSSLPSEPLRGGPFSQCVEAPDRRSGAVGPGEVRQELPDRREGLLPSARGGVERSEGRAGVDAARKEPHLLDEARARPPAPAPSGRGRLPEEMEPGERALLPAASRLHLASEGEGPGQVPAGSRHSGPGPEAISAATGPPKVTGSPPPRPSRARRSRARLPRGSRRPPGRPALSRPRRSGSPLRSSRPGGRRWRPREVRSSSPPARARPSASRP